MAISGAQRADLYTCLADVLGPECAVLLMTQLPRYDVVEVVTKSDIAELRAELHGGLASVNQRLDRLYPALLACLFGVLAAMTAVIFVAS